MLFYCNSSIANNNFFFSDKSAFPKIWGHPAHTQQRLYSHNTFILKMSQIPERSRSKPSTALTVSYNLLHPESSTCPPPNTSPLSPIFYALYKNYKTNLASSRSPLCDLDCEHFSSFHVPL